MRPVRDANGNITAYDILVAGYTYEFSTGKYRIALVDLLEQNSIDIVAPPPPP